MRARDLGVPLEGQTGPLNAITDVPGLEVGFTTLVTDDHVGIGADEPAVIRTGVTAILPRGRAKAGTPCAAGVAVLNGNGELTGRSWIEESGQLQAPIAITNSHSVGAVHRGIDRWMARHHPGSATAWMLPVVGETWDGYLNSINADAVLPEHAETALDAASTGPVAEGNVGGGTGMNCYGFKGGTGTASRVVRVGEGSWTVGVLLQANFGSRDELKLSGRALGRESQAPNPMETSGWFEREAGGRSTPGAGSIIVVVATDAPLLPKQCEALARRVPRARTHRHNGQPFLGRHLSRLLHRERGCTCVAHGENRRSGGATRIHHLGRNRCVLHRGRRSDRGGRSQRSRCSAGHVWARRTRELRPAPRRSARSVRVTRGARIME